MTAIAVTFRQRVKVSLVSLLNVIIDLVHCIIKLIINNFLYLTIKPYLHCWIGDVEFPKFGIFTKASNEWPNNESNYF